jgi:DNA polymerase III delta prime subunit
MGNVTSSDKLKTIAERIHLKHFSDPSSHPLTESSAPTRRTSCAHSKKLKNKFHVDEKMMQQMIGILEMCNSDDTDDFTKDYLRRRVLQELRETEEGRSMLKDLAKQGRMAAPLVHSDDEDPKPTVEKRIATAKSA